MPTFAEIMRMAGKSAPEIEQTLAQKAKQSEEAMLAKQIREHEYNQALASTPEPDSRNFQTVGEPYGGALSTIPTPEGGARVPSDMSMVPVDVTKSMSAPDISPEDFNKFNVAKATEGNYNALKDPMALGAVGAAGLGAAALMGSGGSKSSPAVPVAQAAPEQKVPIPASVTTQESPEEKVEKSKYDRLMAMMAPRKEQVMEMPGGGTSLGSDQELKAAMALRDRNKNYNDIEKGVQLFASGMSGTDYGKTGGNLLEEQGKLVDQPVKDLQARIENQDNDPKSSTSVAMRGLATKMGFHFPDNTSAADIKKQVPQMTSLINHRETLEANRQNLVLKQLERHDSQKSKQDDKDTAMLIKVNEKLNSPEMGSSRSSLGKAQMRINGAQGIRALIKSESNPDKLTGRQVYEIAKSLDGMLALGSPTISGTDKLLPKTLMSEIAKGGEYMANRPVGAQMGKFVSQMQHLIDREEKVSRMQIDGFKEKLLAGYPKDFRERRKDDFENLVKTHAVNANPEYDQSGNLVTAGSAELQSGNIAPKASEAAKPNEVVRKTKDGRTAVFDASTKQFLRYQD